MIERFRFALRLLGTGHLGFALRAHGQMLGHAALGRLISAKGALPA
jgi:hypothetical protein